MEEIIVRFVHLAEQISEKLDNQSLAKCREAGRSWKKIIDAKKYSWSRICNTPKYFTDGATHLQVAIRTGQAEMFETILEEKEEKNTENEFGINAFHYAAFYGNFEVCQKIFEKVISDKISIDLNGKAFWRETNEEYNMRKMNGIFCVKSTPFHLTCLKGHLEIAKLILKNSTILSIDLNATADQSSGFINYVKDFWDFVRKYPLKMS